MNIELLERVKAHILEEPKRLDMERWIIRANLFDDYEIPVIERPACGTIACIAGWASQLSEPTATSSLIWESAQENLDLDYDQALRLFHLEAWPHSYRREYDIADSPVERAKATAARIDHFIATDGGK